MFNYSHFDKFFSPFEEIFILSCSLLFSKKYDLTLNVAKPLLSEYCASRAVPTVNQSDYLATIGARLLPGIDIMWTGPKVISKRITICSIEELTDVLKRPPVIWDNIHANDYDPRRLFLGPYNGRSPELIPYLRGVMTNPNCEFESNFIAMHTLAQWSKSNLSGAKKDSPSK